MYELAPYKELDYGDDQLMVADYLSYTKSHGPGARFALWLQGCLRRCPDCINGPMLKIKEDAGDAGPGDLVNSEALLQQIRMARDSVGEVHGLTVMGGEPFLQARGLVPVLESLVVKESPSMNVLIFSGYTIEELQALNNSAVNDLLALTDTLIDGVYLTDQFDPNRVAGSSNQRIIHLTDRLKDGDFSRRGQESLIKFGKKDISVGKSGIKI